MRAALMVSFAKIGQASSSARPRATSVFPLAAGPETIRYCRSSPFEPTETILAPRTLVRSGLPDEAVTPLRGDHPLGAGVGGQRHGTLRDGVRWRASAIGKHGRMEGALERWCVTFLGSAPARELFRTGHLSDVVAVALVDGREVVIKIRAPSPRLAASVRVQRHLRSRGYPCPDVLAGPEPLGELMATAETHVPARGTPPEPPPPEPTAQLLDALVDFAPPANEFRR